MKKQVQPIWISNLDPPLSVQQVSIKGSNKITWMPNRKTVSLTYSKSGNCS